MNEYLRYLGMKNDGSQFTCPLARVDKMMNLSHYYGGKVPGE
jgi:hypothetical protein